MMMMMMMMTTTTTTTTTTMMMMMMIRRRQENKARKFAPYYDGHAKQFNAFLFAALAAAGPAKKALTFGRLPDVLWLRVMSLLDLYDRFQLTQTCLLFRQLFFHPLLWQRVELVCSVGTLPPTTAAYGMSF
jgi:hypothetical protein